MNLLEFHSPSLIIYLGNWRILGTVVDLGACKVRHTLILLMCVHVHVLFGPPKVLGVSCMAMFITIFCSSGCIDGTRIRCTMHFFW